MTSILRNSAVALACVAAVAIGLAGPITNYKPIPSAAVQDGATPWWSIDSSYATNVYRTNSAIGTNSVMLFQFVLTVDNNLKAITNYLATNQISATNSIYTTNAPSAGDALRWNGTNFYWAP